MAKQKRKLKTIKVSKKWYKSIPSIIWVMGIVAFLAVVSIRQNFEINQPVASPEPAQSPINWKQITNPKVVFFSKIFLSRNKTYIGIPFKYFGGNQTTWLMLEGSSNDLPMQWLVNHPILNGITWPHIEAGNVYLYQKKQQYKTIEEFINNPPSQDKVVADESVIKLNKYSGLKITPLSEYFDINKYDFVLTTYKNSDHKNNELYYSNTVDASSGTLSSNDKLTWEINVPSATTSSPYSIGEVHVDYR